MSKLKKIIISVVTLALCVGVSFAWINELQNPSGRVITLKLTNAAISDSELNVRLYVDIDEDQFEDITKSVDDEEAKLEKFDDFAPGSRRKFRVDITNTSQAPVRLRIILADIICENEQLKEHIVIGTNGFNGFTTNYPAPTVMNQRLCDGIDESGGFVLVDSVEIPPHNEGECVSIYFYVSFSAAGTEDFEDQSFSIGTINFLSL